jgi:hypothetical protein
MEAMTVDPYDWAVRGHGLERYLAKHAGHCRLLYWKTQTVHSDPGKLSEEESEASQ